MRFLGIGVVVINEHERHFIDNLRKCVLVLQKRCCTTKDF